MIHIATLLLSLSGFALLLLSSTRQDWLRHKMQTKQVRVLRLTSFLLLALAFVVIGVGLGVGYGTVEWFGSLTIAAALTVTANTNREHIMRNGKS